MKGKQCNFFGLVVLAAFLSFVSLSASAETKSSKIAVVDLRIAITSTEAGKSEIKAFKEGDNYISLKAKYESSAADLQGLVKELESKRLTWSPEELAEHQKKISYVKADVELAFQKITTEQNQLEQRIFNKLTPLLEESVQEIINEEDITILLRSDSLVFTSAETSITSKVADRIDAKFNAKVDSK